jgi:HAD superfamily hydrolase (TIGR01549 family)
VIASSDRLNVILDVDGTLVDTNYQHALAWYRALRAHGHTAQMWEIHRHIGMGGDQIVAALAGDRVEEEAGDEIRSAESEAYAELIGEVEAMDGAAELLKELKEEGATTILASSAKEGEVEHYVELLDAADLIEGWTSSADVERTKPHPDLVHAALEKVGDGPVVMVGDSTWDVKAATAAGVPTLAVLTGGFSAEELREAGAAAIAESIGKLREERDRLASVAC